MVSQTVQQAIREAVTRSPKLSQNAILREIREDGYRISNLAGRTIVNEARIALTRDLVSEFQAVGQRTTFTNFTFRERDLSQRSRDYIERVLRQNIRNREVFINDRGRRQRISDFKFVLVQYTASALFTTRIQGRLFEETRDTISGQFTTPVEAFTEELIGERVRQTAMGIFISRLSQQSGLAPSSVIDGVTVEMTQLNIDFDALKPRG